MVTATAKKATTTKTPAKPAAKAQSAQAPKATPKADPTPAPLPTTLVEALTSGAAQLFKVRANGTRRSLPYLAVGSEERKAAEAVAARREKGETIPVIAVDLKVSVATARRFLTNLQNAQDVEAGKHDDKWTPETKEVVVHRVEAKA
jgi:hypothetical protein